MVEETNALNNFSATFDLHFFFKFDNNTFNAFNPLPYKV